MKINRYDNKFANIAIYSAVLSPIASLYGTGGISLAMILVLFSFVLMISNGLITKIKSVFCIVLSLFVIIQLIFNNHSTSVLLRTIQYLLLLTIPFMIKYKNLNLEKGIVFYRYVSVFASFFLILQYFCLHFLHIYISGIIDNPFFLPSESLSEALGGTIENGRRLSGIFSEPASYSVYVLGAYAITLFDKKIRKKFICISILSVGILCSVSSTGILTMCGLFVLRFFYNVKSSLKWISHPKHIFVIFLLFVVLVYIVNTGIQDLFLYRIEEGNSARNRFIGFSILASQSLSELLMGHGMDLEALQDFYFSGFPRYIYYFGFIGLSLWLLMLTTVIRKLESKFRYLGLTYLILNTGESAMLGFSGYLFMMFLCYAKYGKSNITNRFLLPEK